ncbi:MAG: PepSY domain-containing protein [Bdellovibrio bacteriovorus]
MRYRILALAILVALAPIGAAWGDRGGRDKGGDRRSSEGRQSSESRASERARKETGGRVLGVKPSNEGYRVKILTPKGEVRSIQVPDR